MHPRDSLIFPSHHVAGFYPQTPERFRSYLVYSAVLRRLPFGPPPHPYLEDHSTFILPSIIPSRRFTPVTYPWLLPSAIILSAHSRIEPLGDIFRAPISLFVTYPDSFILFGNSQCFALDHFYTWSILYGSSPGRPCLEHPFWVNLSC